MSHLSEISIVFCAAAFTQHRILFSSVDPICIHHDIRVRPISLEGHCIMLYHSLLTGPNTQIGMNHTARSIRPTQHANLHESTAWPVGRLSSSRSSLVIALMDGIAKERKMWSQ